MKVKIIDIAKRAGVSAGTVDRVLHKRGHVSPDKQKLVEKALEELNYEPNLLASFLASKRKFTLAAIVPSYTKGSYWELACRGIEQAATEMEKFNTQVDLLHFDQYDVTSFRAVAEPLLTKGYDGVIIATLFEQPVIRLSQKLDEQNIPYIFIDSDIPNQKNLSYFGSDTFVSGKIAARLLLSTSNKMKTIFFAHIKFKRSEISVQMRNRENGFLHFLKNMNYDGSIHHIEVNPDNHLQGFLELENLLENSEFPVGGIVLNSRMYEFIDVLKHLPNHLRKKLHLIGHDAIIGNVNALKNGDIMFLLSQRTDLQGYDAVKALVNYLAFKEEPKKVNYMPIDILLAENVDYYNNY